MEIRRKEFREKFERACRLSMIPLVIAWLFSAISYYATKHSTIDWFSRSGSVMALAGAVATFRLTGLLQGQLATGLREGLGTLERGFELTLDPPRPYKSAIYFGYLSGVVGTIIWGYGDLIMRWISSLFGRS
jgi:hypothetical protein